MVADMRSMPNMGPSSSTRTAYILSGFGIPDQPTNILKIVQLYCDEEISARQYAAL